MERQQELKQWLHQHVPGRPNSIQTLAGDASFRIYHRCRYERESFILVDACPTRENNQAFIDTRQLFHSIGLQVPVILAADVEQGFLLLQDFGDRLLFDALQHDEPTPRYQQALACLSKLQACDVEASHLPVYSYEMMRAESNLFTEWYLSRYLNLSLTQAELAVLDQAYHEIAHACLTQPQVCTHRDFQSRNIMVLEDDSLGLIDFQDAVRGPISYDLVSLLKDCYIDWPVTFVADCVAWFCHNNQLDVETFSNGLEVATLQRHLKNMGIFARLALRDHKPHYLQYMPRVMHYILQSLTHCPTLSPCYELLQQRVLPTIQPTSDA